MRLNQNQKKFTAAFLLVTFVTSTFSPGISYGLTSGPVQPESASFQPAGVNDLVDLFSGNLNYSIPLFEIGDYPINLTYKSGNTEMEDEASWVGCGWILNPGAVNRNLRGLPDDFKGDKVEKVYNKREYKKVGGNVVLKATLFGNEESNSSGVASISLGVYKDNYYGIGANVSTSIGFSLAKNTSTPLTAGLNLNSDARDGVSISPNFSLNVQKIDIDESGIGSGLSGSLSYNTRSGLQALSLGQSFKTQRKFNEYRSSSFDLGGTATYYFGQTYTPTIRNNSKNYGFSFSFDLGLEFLGAFGGVGGQGFYYKETIPELEKLKSVPAYGYLNYPAGQKNIDVLLDFNREKDGVFVLSAPAIATPVSTHDLFDITSQEGSSQFRPVFNGNYITFDPVHTNVTDNTTGGFLFGYLNTVQFGARLNETNGEAVSKKWTAQNSYLTKAEYIPDGKPDEEVVYFKKSGELVKADAEYFSALKNTSAVAVLASGNQTAFTEPVFTSLGESPTSIPNIIKRNKRDIRTSTFSYLTASQASKYGFTKNLRYFSSSGNIVTEPRQDLNNSRQPHHISEIRVTDKNGKRFIYGLPVYNLLQKDITFSVNPPSEVENEMVRRNGLIDYSSQLSSDSKFEHISHDKGREGVFAKETKPGYATSFLLTGIVSDDYVDTRMDGITDDDIGSYLRFDYKKFTNNSKKYKWRAPYDFKKAYYNEAHLSDPKDDRASFIYGEKELFYLYTIENKAMVAVFETSDREDGLGVQNVHGGQYSGNDKGPRLQKLDKIKICTKVDWLNHINSGKPLNPVKTIHFEYDYSLYSNAPNNSGADIVQNGLHINLNKGKLTLKKLYFTFGNNLNKRGETNPYIFEYDESLIISKIANLPVPVGVGSAVELDGSYAPKQADRWGTYRPNWFSGYQTGQGREFNNSEFPYSLQDNDNSMNYSEKLLADAFASKWQLNKITTPAGAEITVHYESDDYAYVQDRRAMQMCLVKGIGNTNGNDQGLENASKILIELPFFIKNRNFSDANNEFLKRYLEGIENLFYKFFVSLDGKRIHSEFIQGYAEIDKPKCKLSSVNSFTEGTNVVYTRAEIAFKMVNGVNPITKAAWQFLKTDLPQYAYDNYDNTDVDGDMIAVIKSIITAVKNIINELGKPYETIFSNKGFANKVTLSKSMVRLNNPNYKKLGGGARVKIISINDKWADMAGVAGYKNSTNGIKYDYTTTINDLLDADGKPFTISSGVASYEPQIGNEENPFHEPVKFVEKVHWSHDRYHYIEKPFCESYFPPASVNYSRVKVTRIGDNNVEEVGYTINEFYTAKDFPTNVEYIPIRTVKYQDGLSLMLFSSTSQKKVVASQGFKVELNDMHGKAKSTKVYNRGGELISSLEYYYNISEDDPKRISNKLYVLKDADITKVELSTVGEDIDLITDVRENINTSMGTSTGAYFGLFTFPPFPIPFIPSFPIPFGNVNVDVSSNVDAFNSVSTIKVVQKYGVLKSVRKMQNGSSITTENMLWDGNTGEVLVTKVQNEFNDYSYSFKYPAYLINGQEGMGHNYKNLGVTFSSLSTDINGKFLNPLNTSDYLYPGDELVALNKEQHAWVIKDYNNELRLIDFNGDYLNETNETYTVLKSGRRNKLDAWSGSIITMKNPIIDNDYIDISVVSKILQAQAITYKDEWSIPAVKYAITEVNIENYCIDPINQPINPYVMGLLGNWRAEASYDYAIPREQKPGLPTQKGGTDLRHSGYFKDFDPFWVGVPSQKRWKENPLAISTDRWIFKNKPIYFDRNCNQIENIDALNRYGAALYGFQNSLAVAVAGNARRKEIAFEGFEDYRYNTFSDPCPLTNKKHLDFGIYLADTVYRDHAGNKIVDLVSHTGKYSLKLQEASSFSAYANASPASSPSGRVVESSSSNNGKYILKHNEPLKGFSPTYGNEKYLLSFWVYDSSLIQRRSNKQNNLQIKINNQSIDLSQAVFPVVEGWRRIEIPFEQYSNLFQLHFYAEQTVYLDDIRIVPFKGQLSSYVYDDKNLRLMAQLDENNFATFYEYDEDGTLIRIKKETEKGIMTLKETRKYLRAPKNSQLE